jgi:intracellular sulfur oxidation DsrE/DsrF family protein
MRSLLFLSGAVLLATASDPIGAPRFEHPLIQDHGGIVVLPDAAEPPRKDSKVLLDITSEEMRGGVLKGLDRAAVFVNLYEQAEVGPKNGMKLSVVIHGPATKAVLNDEAYARHAGTQEKNPNRELIRQLKLAGVDIYVCGQALARQKFHTEDVLPDVAVAVSAATVHINQQMNGYVLVP